MLSEVKRVFILVVLSSRVRVAVVIRLSGISGVLTFRVMVLIAIQACGVKSFVHYFCDTCAGLIHLSLLRVVFSPGLFILLDLVSE